MERPWISVNFAISADGKISSVKNQPSGWTSEADHLRLLALRENADALLVGKGTLIADGMSMIVPDRKTQPLRCIVSRSGILDPDLPVFRKPGGDIHLCVTGDSRQDVPGVTVHHLPLAGFLTTLARQHGVRSLHCEGGGQLARELMELDAIDEFHLTVAGHTIFGGQDAPTVTGIPKAFAAKSSGFTLEHFEPLPASGECFLTYVRKRRL